MLLVFDTDYIESVYSSLLFKMLRPVLPQRGRTPATYIILGFLVAKLARAKRSVKRMLTTYFNFMHPKYCHFKKYSI